MSIQDLQSKIKELRAEAASLEHQFNHAIINYLKNNIIEVVSCNALDRDGKACLEGICSWYNSDNNLVTIEYDIMNKYGDFVETKQITVSASEITVNISEITEEIKQNEEKYANQWFRTNDELPKEGQDVLICNWFGRITRNENISVGDIKYMENNPMIYTAWMPTPNYLNQTK